MQRRLSGYFFPLMCCVHVCVCMCVCVFVVLVKCWCYSYSLFPYNWYVSTSNLGLFLFLSLLGLQSPFDSIKIVKVGAHRGRRLNICNSSLGNKRCPSIKGVRGTERASRERRGGPEMSSFRVWPPLLVLERQAKRWGIKAQSKGHPGS